MSAKKSAQFKRAPSEQQTRRARSTSKRALQQRTRKLRESLGQIGAASKAAVEAILMNVDTLIARGHLADVSQLLDAAETKLDGGNPDVLARELAAARADVRSMSNKVSQLEDQIRRERGTRSGAEQLGERYATFLASVLRLRDNREGLDDLLLEELGQEPMLKRIGNV